MTHHRINHDQNGFTLIELLVVILIIGILAAIALPAFLGQQKKAQDATAKSDARNLVSQVEACFTNTDGYLGCTAEIAANGGAGLDIGNGPGQVQVVLETTNGYEITATSKAQDGGANHTFTIVHNIGGVFSHTCTPVGQGGCKPSGSW